MLDVPFATGPLGKRRIDGRRLRSERTRRSIIEAYLDLLRENPQQPTASQIAKRAGYGRTVSSTRQRSSRPACQSVR